jgi:Na+/melibiose symporter-like transporter
MIYACYNIQSVGSFVLIPFIFASATKQFWPLLLAYSVEIFAILLVTSVIDSKRMGGRKRIAIVGLIFLASVEVILFFVGKHFIIPAVILMRFAIRIVWSSLIVLNGESFPTRTEPLE